MDNESKIFSTFATMPSMTDHVVIVSNDPTRTTHVAQALVRAAAVSATTSTVPAHVSSRHDDSTFHDDDSTIRHTDEMAIAALEARLVEDNSNTCGSAVSWSRRRGVVHVTEQWSDLCHLESVQHVVLVWTMAAAAAMESAKTRDVVWQQPVLWSWLARLHRLDLVRQRVTIVVVVQSPPDGNMDNDNDDNARPLATTTTTVPSPRHLAQWQRHVPMLVVGENNDDDYKILARRLWQRCRAGHRHNLTVPSSMLMATQIEI